MKKKRRWIKWAVLALAALALLWLVFVSRKTEEASYTEVPVTTGDIATYYNFDGLVHAPRVQTLTSAQEDAVSAVYVVQNQQVKSGDRIMKLKDGGIIRADIDGEITNLPVAEDDIVSAGQTLAQIIDMSRLEIRLNVDEYDVDAVTPGTPALVTILAPEQTYEGTVTALDKNGTASGDLSYYTATVAMGAMEGVYPGMQVSAKVLRSHAENAVLLRMDALCFDEYNKPYVLMRAQNGKDTVKVPVTVGISDGINVVIADGLEAGQTVLEKNSLSMAELMVQMKQQGSAAR